MCVVSLSCFFLVRSNAGDTLRIYTTYIEGDPPNVITILRMYVVVFLAMVYVCVVSL